MRERRKTPYRLAYIAVTSAIALVLLSALVVALLLPYRAALAQSAPTGTISQDTAAHFGGACAVLTDTIVSTANGGEIRLRATVEDYFDGDEIDASQWITGAANTAFPDEAPIVANGVLSLSGSYLLSQIVFSETTPTRFFEASARFASDIRPNDADIGFYRGAPPLQVVQPDPSSIRLFISQPANFSSQPDVARLLYVRSRDGDSSIPLFDTAVDNWSGDFNAQRAALAQDRVYRIEWNSSETWYLIDASPIISYAADIEWTDDGGGGFVNVPLPHTGVSTRTTYVLLYAQNPVYFGDDYSPLIVDWVRAGRYPSSGVYTSCTQDAGQIVNWSQSTLTATLPTSTGVVLATRTSLDGVSWSPWSDAAGSIISGTATLTPTSPSGRYLQYRLTLSSSDPLNSPEVSALDFSYFGAASIVVAPASATLNPGAAQQFTAEVRDSRNSVVASAPVTWSVTAGGGVIDNSGLFTAGLPAGVFTNTVTASTENNVTGAATAIVVDLPPVANIGGPYTGVEGQAVELDASNSSDPNGGSVTYAWDLTGNGEYNDATGATPSYTWLDNGEYPISLLVTDSAGLTNTATTTVTIANVDPQIISIDRNTPVRRGQLVTVTVNASDAPSDTLSYSFDWTSNNTFDVENSLSNTAVTSYTATGLYTVTVRVADDDGGVVTGTTTVTVTP
ncbi:MAG: PKD domain-containing protein, partial [Caldilinea sp.]|nr:PKD domain-containing protein [Caldilinea sp.]